MKVLLCGGGNAIHVLSAYISAKPDTHVTILSLFPGEANKLRDAITQEGIRCINDLGGDILGKPNAVIDKAKDVPNDLDVVIFNLPSFTHELYFKALKPYLKLGVIIGAMPGGGGFDFCASRILGSEFVRHSNLFALETLPWICHITEYGKTVEVLETNIDIEVIVSPKHGTADDGFVTDVLHNLIGMPPAFDPADNLSGVTLINKDIAYDDSSLFCCGSDEHSSDNLDEVTGEVVELEQVPLEEYPSPNSLCGVSERITPSHGHDNHGNMSIDTVLCTYKRLRTNEECRGLTHPSREAEVGAKKKCLPNLTYRHFLDVPHRTRRDRRNRRGFVPGDAQGREYRVKGNTSAQ